MQYSIVPGRYDIMGKSLTALKALAGDEIQDDLEGLRRKRRTAHSSSAANAAGGSYYGGEGNGRRQRG